MLLNPQFPADLVTFIGEILDEKLNILYINMYIEI